MTVTEPRILRTFSHPARCSGRAGERMSTEPSALRSVMQSRSASTLSIVDTSDSRGAFVMRTLSPVSSDAHRIGSTAFFEPHVVTEPSSG